jgi:LPXTG-motif cell wall-anchored protein
MRIVRVVLAASCAALFLLGFGGRAFAGAPTLHANDDNVSTAQDTPIDFDPTLNDTVPPPLVVTGVLIESNPSHGTATVTPGTTRIHYVPDTGYTGPDSMEYILCTTTPGRGAGQGGPPCSPQSLAAINITVTPPVVSTTLCCTAPTTSTSVVCGECTTSSAPATTTTVAVAAANELPRTGTDSMPLVALGAVAIAGGVAATLGWRRDRRRA